MDSRSGQIDCKTSPDFVRTLLIPSDLRDDGDPAWCKGFIERTSFTEAGKEVGRCGAVILGMVKEVRSEKAIPQKLAVILEPANQPTAISPSEQRPATLYGLVRSRAAPPILF